MRKLRGQITAVTGKNYSGQITKKLQGSHRGAGFDSHQKSSKSTANIACQRLSGSYLLRP
jgi:hypothetical protein